MIPPVMFSGHYHTLNATPLSEWGQAATRTRMLNLWPSELSDVAPVLKLGKCRPMLWDGGWARLKTPLILEG